MHRSERGVALILVIFIVTLASVLVINLAYSTYLGARVSAGAQRAVQAEYLLKSALSLAQVLVEAGNINGDTSKDIWTKFYDGMAIPTEYLGINQPNLRVSLEIRPDDVRLNLRKLRISDPPTAEDIKWQDVFKTFFTNLDFANDKDEVDQSGFFPKKHFSPQELVGCLIDYQDEDTKSNSNGDCEGSIPNAKDVFSNTFIVSVSELSRIPGFTPKRINKILPFVTAHGNGEFNVNLVAGITEPEPEVLRALSPNITLDHVLDVQKIALSEDPFKGGTDPRFEKIIPRPWTDPVSFLRSSKYYQVIAEVDYGTSRYYLRAHLAKEGSISNLPRIQSMEIF